MRRHVWLWSLLICLPVFTQAAEAVHMPPYQRVVLSNGATLLLMERHDVPLIAFQASVRGGVLTDTADKAGGANLLAKLLMKGAGKRDALQFAEAIEQVGGSFDTGASTESFSVTGQFMARDQKLMIELLADALQRPRLEPSQFDLLRQRQIEFLRAAKDGNLGALVPAYAAAALFAPHPYALPIAGSEAGLTKLSYQDVQQLYQQQFGANRLIVAVSGDFNTKTLLPQLRQAFGNWQRAKATLASVSTPIASKGRRVLLIDAPDSVQTYFWIGNVGIARTNEQRVTLGLVNTLFGGRFTSMLNTELRIKSGLTYGARSQFRELTQPGSWNIYSFTQSATTGKAIDLALHTYDKLRSEGLNDEALSSARNYLLGHYPTDFETAAQWAGTLAELEFYGLSRDEVDRYTERLNVITATQANATLREILPTPDNLLLVLIGNAKVIREQVTQYGPITEWPLAAPDFLVKK